MKSAFSKGLRIARIAAAVSAMLLAGAALSGCGDSDNPTNDDVKHSAAEEGKPDPGQPANVREDRSHQELPADQSSVTAVNSATGEIGGANEGLDTPEENFTSAEPNPDEYSNADNAGEADSLEDTAETFPDTPEDGETPELKKTVAVTVPRHLHIVGGNPYGDTEPPLEPLYDADDDAAAPEYRSDLSEISKMRYLMVKTSRNDTVMPELAQPPIERYDETYGENIVYDYGWQVNATGFRFSSLYGFGAVDDEALEKAARECDKDPVCSRMKKLPEKYISSNKNPCAYTDNSKRLITCSFSDFKNEKRRSLGKNRLIADAVIYDVSGLSFLPKGIIEACELAASEKKDINETDDEYDEEIWRHNGERELAVYNANVLLELIAESAAGTKSILKSPGAGWNYHSPESSEYDEMNREFPSEIATSAFYQEPLKEDPKNKYRLRIRSPCQIDVKKLNKNMHLTVYGRRK
ncbi:hypothetical protein [Succinimonas sp.]|uniref:hypothetical protein n=1 Tax=Succinimonas sp. TaxID=1936151 RepID=UPI00386A7641